MPATWRTSDLTILAVAGAGTVLLTAVSFLVAPPSALPRNDGSSYATHPDGARATFLVLKEVGYRVDRSHEPVAAIRQPPEQTAIVLANPSQPPSQQDVRALRGFVEAGGIVLATGSGGVTFLPDVAQRTDNKAGPPPRLQRARRQDRALPGALTERVDAIEMLPSMVPLPLESSYVVLYGTDQAPAVLTARFGRGRAVWFAGSAPLANGGIGRPNHVELLVNILGPPGARTVLWDEYYHGHTRSFWSYVAATPFAAAGLQVVAIVGAALLTFARRRRPIREPVIEPRTSPLEFIDTMGGLYDRARASGPAVSTVYTHVRRRLLTALRLPLGTGDGRLVAVAAERLSLDPAEVAGALSRARAASADPELTAPQAVPIVAELQTLATRIDGVRRGHIQR
jgi:hypothetical protein